MIQLCTACDPATEWSSEASLKAHMLEVHGTDKMTKAMQMEKTKKDNLPVNLPPGISPEDLPSPDFIEAVQRIETPAPLPPVNIPSVQPIVPQTDRPPVEISLGYHFSGECPICKREVRTIEVKTDKELVVVAYCIFCQKQIQYKKVIPIDEQYKEREVEPESKTGIPEWKSCLEQGEENASQIGDREESNKYTDEKEMGRGIIKRKRKNDKGNSKTQNPRTKEKNGTLKDIGKESDVERE